MKIIDEYYQYWLNVGLDCTPINHAKAEALIDELYVYSGLKPPANKIWFPSPAAIVKETGISASNFFCGQHNANWVSYYAYTYTQDTYSLVTDEKLYQIIVGVTKHLHWYITGESHCFLSERPLYVSFKDKLLHADGKPAILYQDGFAIYSLNGVSVSKEIAETPAAQLDPEIILKETDAKVKLEIVKKIKADKLNSKILFKETDAEVRMEIVRKMGADKIAPDVLLKEANAEVRREIVRKVGVERLEKKLKPRVLDKWGDYELHDYSEHFRNMRCKPVYLKMKNPSIGAWHYEGVNIREMSAPTCKAALEWRLKGKDFNPKQIT